jgi:hypothetical protein
MVAELAGADVYRARSIAGERIAIRAIRVATAAGEGRRAVGATVAYHLPNRGASVDEGLYKKVILVSHAEAFHPIYAARARLVLDADQAALVTGAESVLDTTFHEFAHGLGAHDELPLTVGGVATNVGEAMGDLSSLMEEEKADDVGLWLMERRRQAGHVDDAQAARWYVTHVMHLFGLLQYPLGGTYPRMVAIQLGHLMEAGAVTYDGATGHFRVHLERMPDAVESLARQVVRLQLTGDRAGAQALHDRWVRRDGEGYALVETLAGPVEAMRARFADAGIRSVCMDYRVTGL